MDNSRPWTVLQLNTRDAFGGAAKVAWELHQAYRSRGIDAWMAVGSAVQHDPHVVELENLEARSAAARAAISLHSRLRESTSFGHDLQYLGEPRRWWDIVRGREDYHYPGTWRLLDMLAARPNIIHAHNLHGGYFDLRALPWLSRQAPLVMTLHDAWLLSGHCSHSLTCPRWTNGCGDCPDLSIYPAIRRDSTAYNWRRKRDLFRESRLFVATPSQWLMDKVKQSILQVAIVESQVIPNGINLSVFQPCETVRARSELNLPQDVPILLFSAENPGKNRFKDLQTLSEAVNIIAAQLSDFPLHVLAVGSAEDKVIRHDNGITYVPYQTDPQLMARYYQAADLYLHTAKADTFPNAILEALACGTPVVATAVGGIPEQIKSLESMETAVNTSYSAKNASGILTSAGNAEAMAAAVLRLITDKELRRRLGHNAAADASERFDLKRQVETYLKWYRSLTDHPVEAIIDSAIR